MNLRLDAFHLAAFVLALAACTPDAGSSAAPTSATFENTAELIVTNATIYTQDPKQGEVDAMAIAAGRIVALGDAEKVMQFAGPATNVVDLHGQFVMPGLIDAHAHPAWGGLMVRFQCLFPATALPNEVRETIAGCVANAPDNDVWIQGGTWAAEFFSRFQIDSPRAWLDAISGNKAIALRDDSGHNYWVNSKAFEIMGIDEDTPPPKGGSYPKDSDGRLNGVMLEAFAVVGEALPAWTAAHYKEGIAYAMNNAHQYGITGWKDASASEAEARAYNELDQAGALKVNVATSLVQMNEDPSTVDVDRYTVMRETYASEHVHTDFVKIFLDGIPTTARTAAMVNPYVKVEEGAQDEFGPLHVPVPALIKAVTELDAKGFTVKIHAAGDRSVNEALNAIEHARKTNGMSDRRHELAHAGFILDADIPRFAELNVVADLSPHLWFPSPIVESVRTALGPRGLRYWPNRDLLDAGAPLLMGSDWPSVAPDLNPWIGLEALVTRADPTGSHPGSGWRSQALTLDEGIEVMTMGGARALRLDRHVGSLEIGKSADFAVLSANPFAIPIEEVSEIRALATYFEGQQVYAVSE